MDSLGILDQQIMHDFSSAIFENNGARLIDMIERVNNSGIDLKKYYSDLIVHFRNLNVIKICGKENSGANITDSEKEKIFQITLKLSSGYINTILRTLLKEESLVKYSSHTRTAIEMVLLKLLQINPGEQIDKIISSLDILAKQINLKFPDVEYKSNQRLNSMVDDSVKEKIISPAVKKQVQEPLPVPEKIQNQENLSNKKKTWQGFLKKIEQKFPFMFTLLSKGYVNEKDSTKIIVELKECSSFDKKRIENKKPELQKICNEFLGKHLTINILSENSVLPQNNKKKNDIKAKQAAFNHPFVVEAQKLFNGEIINY